MLSLYNISTIYKLQRIKEVNEWTCKCISIKCNILNMEVTMLKLSLKQGQYLNIGDNIRVVYLGGTGSHGRFMIDAPKDVNIVRSNVEQNPERNKDTYYPESPISKEAQEQIRHILREEKLKAEKSAQQAH